MTPFTIQLFVNPQAGSASRRRVAALRAAFAAAGARVIETACGDDPLAVADAADHVCAVGGDGTLRHVAAAVRRAGRPIGMSLYPSGTVNLLAHETGYRREPTSFVRRILGGIARTHHSGLIGAIPFFTCASVGPDADAVAGLSVPLKRRIGRAAYGWAFLKLLAHWPRPSLRVIHDGGTIRCEAVYVAKGHFFAGPWSFAPDAALTDPLLHIVTIERATRWLYLRFLWTLLRHHSPAYLPGVRTFTCTSLRIEGDAPIQADGDIVAKLPVDIRIDPETLAFA